MYRFAEGLSESRFPSCINTSPDTIIVTTIVNKGVEAQIGGALYRGGCLAFTVPDDTNDPKVVKMLDSAQSVFTLSRNSQLLAFFSLKDDTIRLEVPGVLEELRSRNIELYMFSGNRLEVVIPIATELRIPLVKVYADCYPEDKRARL
jgi:cation transport ATPase